MKNSKSIRPFLSACVLLMAWIHWPVAAHSGSPIHIGNRLEPFVDDSLIESLSGAQLRLHRPTPREVVIVHDQPWEGNVSAYHTVFQDGDLYRMYYRGAHYDEAAREQTHPQFVCYAESRDGIHWTKPNLSLVEFDGSVRNNIVWDGVGAHNFAPFKDANPTAANGAGYKALGSGPGGLYAFKSPDGIHWTLMRETPVITRGAFDSQNLAFWDVTRNWYVDYHRAARNGLRDILTCNSADFLEWTEPDWIEYRGAPPEHLYTNQITPYSRAPHLFLGFPKRFDPSRNPANHPYAGVSDGVFMTSRNGRDFHRWGEAIIRPGPQKDRWVNRNNMTAWGVVETESAVPGTPPELSIYSTEGYYRGDGVRLRRFTWRLDGFCSIEAPLSGGELVTRPLVFRGDRLTINYATSGSGSIRVEVQDVDGAALPGFSLSEAEELVGDEIAGVVRWRGDQGPGDLAGRPVRLRFVMKDADLHAIHFTGDGEPDASASRGVSLPKLLTIRWRRGPDLPHGFQDSDGGVLNLNLISVGGFCSGQEDVATKPNKYPRGFFKNTWGLDLVDPDAEWTALPEFPGDARQELSAVVVGDALYCWGGFSYTEPFCYRDGYRLTRSNAGADWSWDRLPELPWPVASGGLVSVGSRIFFMGGSDYDLNRFYTQGDRNGEVPRMGSRMLSIDTQDLEGGWREMASCPGTPRWVHAVAAVGDLVYVIGGGTGNDNSSGSYCTVVDNWCYDTRTDSWRRLPDTPIATGNFPAGAIVYAGRYIILLGGYQDGNVLSPDGSLSRPYGTVFKHYPDNDYNSDVLVFDTATESFGRANPMPLCNNLPMAAVQGRDIHLIGGETGNCVIDGRHYGHHPDLHLIGTIETVSTD